jgi:UPF0716 protein FxsA
MRLPFSTRLGFVLAVVAELAVFVLAVRTIGGWATFWLVLATTFLGGWVIRKEGLRAWTSISEALRTGQAPGRNDAPSRAVMAGGLLLVAPGFLTDLIGLLLVVPGTREWISRRFGRLLPSPRPSGPVNGGTVIQGEVIDPDDPHPRSSE